MRRVTYAGMSCKLHPIHPASVSGGVCATCLRDRLLDLLAAQARESESGDDRRNSDLPPPHPFPRSVSPYVCRRSVDDRRHLLFYSTPQVGPTFSGDGTGKTKKKQGRFSLFKSLFRSPSVYGSSRSGKIDGAPNESSPSNSSPSWISSLLPRSRKKKSSRLFSLDDECSGAGARRSCPVLERGMSPSSAERRGVGGDESPTGSGYWSESSTGRRKRVPAQTKRGVGGGGAPQHSRSVSGLAFCLSPLVSHHHRRVETGLSGEFRISNRPHLSTAASFSSNRSRKLVDFGRYP